MSRLTIGLFVAAVAGAAGWWASQRAATPRNQIALGNGSQKATPAPESIDPKMVVTPKADIDPKMVKPVPNVDPKMVVKPQPPVAPKDQQPPNPSDD